MRIQVLLNFRKGPAKEPGGQFTTGWWWRRRRILWVTYTLQQVAGIVRWIDVRDVLGLYNDIGSRGVWLHGIGFRIQTLLIEYQEHLTTNFEHIHAV